MSSAQQGAEAQTLETFTPPTKAQVWHRPDNWNIHRRRLQPSLIDRTGKVIRCCDCQGLTNLSKDPEL